MRSINNRTLRVGAVIKKELLQMNLVTEYLIIVDKEASEAFYHLCDNVDEFNKLLTSDSDISIKDNVIAYKSNLKANYHVKTNKVRGKPQRFFHVKIIYDGNEKDMDEYVKLLHSIRGIIHRSGGQPETLWDDVSLFYSQKSYLLIHKVENLMRKLITYFMLTNIGKEWVKQTSPGVVMDAIDKSKRKQYLDVLYQIDFIHLGDFLFKPYQIKDTKDLLLLISKAQSQDDLKLDELKAFEAKSNWEKYFSKIVDCTDEFLDKRWKELYELRCSVAHNALLNKVEYERVSRLVSEIESRLQKAIDNLDKVRVPQADKEQVAENVASSISTDLGEFIHAWKLFEKATHNAVIDLGMTTEKFRTIHQSIQVLREKEVIDDEFHRDILELIRFRNLVVHDSRIDFTEPEIRSNIAKLDELTKTLKRSWKDETYNAIVQLGGEANLADIYEYIESHSARKLPSTWQATVRYVLQVYCSDTETYKGGDDVFHHISRGRWGVKPKNTC